jgi:hypothetical protein
MSIGWFVHSKYRKTIGSLLMILAFVLQWTSTNFFLGDGDALEHDTSELQQQVYEVEYLLTKDPKYLSDARNMAQFRYFALENTSEVGGFKETDRKLAEEMFLNAPPATWEAYQDLMTRLGSAMGKTLMNDYVHASVRNMRFRHAQELATFVLSLSGLLLIWLGEAFEAPQK